MAVLDRSGDFREASQSLRRCFRCFSDVCGEKVNFLSRQPGGAVHPNERREDALDHG